MRRRALKVADLVGALSTEALLGTDTPFQSRIHELRAYPGQLASAANLWSLMQGSGLRESHREDDLRVQDPYSVRCMPQVHGAVRDVLADVERRLGIEMNAVTDNPLVFAEDDEILAGGTSTVSRSPWRRLSGDRDSRAGLDQRAPNRQADGFCLFRSATVPDRGSGSQFGVHDRSGHRGGPG